MPYKCEEVSWLPLGAPFYKTTYIYFFLISLQCFNYHLYHFRQVSKEIKQMTLLETEVKNCIGRNKDFLFVYFFCTLHTDIEVKEND